MTLENFQEQMDFFIRARGERPAQLIYKCNEDLVRSHGQFYEPAGTQPFQPIARACFGQSYRIATRKNSHWTYVEGYASHPRTGLVVAHAWITRPDAPGQAFDLAWDGDLSDAIYLGIPFRAGYVRKVHLASKRQYYGVLDAWWMDYPLLTGKTALAEVTA